MKWWLIVVFFSRVSLATEPCLQSAADLGRAVVRNSAILEQTLAPYCRGGVHVASAYGACMAGKTKGFFVDGLYDDAKGLGSLLLTLGKEGERMVISQLPGGEWALHAFGIDTTQDKLKNFVKKWGPKSVDVIKILYRLKSDPVYQYEIASKVSQAVMLMALKTQSHVKSMACDDVLGKACEIYGKLSYKAAMTVLLAVITAEAGGAGAEVEMASIARAAEAEPEVAEFVTSVEEAFSEDASVAAGSANKITQTAKAEEQLGQPKLTTEPETPGPTAQRTRTLSAGSNRTTQFTSLTREERSALIERSKTIIKNADQATEPYLTELDEQYLARMADYDKRAQYSQVLTDDAGNQNGFLFAKYDNRTARVRIDKFAVSSDLRGSGLGTRMLNQMVQQVIKSGKTDIELYVLKENTKGIAYYLSLGFKDISALEPAPTERPCLRLVIKAADLLAATSR